MDNIQITKDCIQAINNIGSTTYQNICNGNMNTVPWGTGDWFMGLFISALVIVPLIIFYKIFRD
jgi:hypothetical protein